MFPSGVPGEEIGQDGGDLGSMSQGQRVIGARDDGILCVREPLEYKSAYFGQPLPTGAAAYVDDRTGDGTGGDWTEFPIQQGRHIRVEEGRHVLFHLGG